jgi:adenylate cyclase
VKLGDDARDLTLHIGINSGHGVARMIGSDVRMDYAVLGDSVILAQRLESAAPPGETYIGETTQRLVRDRFELEPVGPLILKGKAEPVPAWRLLGQRAPVVGEVAVGPGLVGRDEELAALGGVLDGLAGGTGAFVALIGEPGVGKSRLTQAVHALASANGIRWLEARCLSYGAGLPYWPYADLARRLAEIRPDDSAEVAADKLSNSLETIGLHAQRHLIGQLLGVRERGGAKATESLEPEAFRRALHEALASWVRALSRRGPLCLTLEDAHWADASSLALTRDLARLTQDEPVMLYLTARPSASAAFSELITSPQSQVSLNIELQPLTDEAVVALAQQVLDGAPPPRLMSFLAERGSGNPFFIEEMVRAVRDAGALVRDDERWRLRPDWDAAELPPTVEGVLASRIDTLPTRAAATLQVASVIGRRVRLPLLRGMASDSDDLDRSLAELVASGLLDRSQEHGEETVTFHHALVQDVAYARLLRRRKRELHTRAAEVAEALYGATDDVIDLLARHLYLGGGGQKAVEYLVRAATRAQRLFANDEAIVHLQHAAELVRKDTALLTRLPQILLDLADLHELRGDYETARATYREARDLTGDVQAWRGIASSQRRQGHFDAALAAVEEAFVALEGADVRSLWLERGWSLSAGGRLTDAATALHTGLTSTSDAADIMTGDLLIQLSRVESAAGSYRPALEHAKGAERIFEEHAHLRGLATALRVRGGIHHDLEEFDEAAGALQRALDVAQRVGSVEEIGGSLINLGLVERDRGDLAVAIECDRRAIDELARVGHATMLTIAYGNLSEKLVRLGDLVEAEAKAVRTGELAASIGHGIMQAQSLETLAEIRLKQDRPAEAAELAEAAAAGFEAADATPLAAECLELAATALRAAGDAGRADALETRARSMAALVG